MSDETTKAPAAQPAKKVTLGAADILNSSDRKTIPVDVPEWGGIVLVQSMTGEEAAQLGDAGSKAEGIARIVALSLVDEAGHHLFTVEDIPKLQKKSFRAMVRIQDVVLELNGLTAEAQKILKKD
jgi:hypothetical protein